MRSDSGQLKPRKSAISISSANCWEATIKLATYRIDQTEKVGLVHDDHAQVFDLAASVRRMRGSEDAAFDSMLSLIDAGPTALDRARAAFDRYGTDPDLSVTIREGMIRAPVPQPRQMRDGMAFALHIQQAMHAGAILRARAERNTGELARLESGPLPELPDIYRRQPIYYFTNRLSVQGTDSTVWWPRYSAIIDYELEFGVVTKGRGADISSKRASEHIFGYTIFNDFSARDAQSVEMEGKLGPAKGKSFDGGNVLGPWIVTPDEIADPYNLAMEVRVNGQRRSNGTSRGMLFSFEEMIAHISQDETLYPGEFIGSGTVGNGCGLELSQFLVDEDVVELDVERIGILRNRVRRKTE